MPALLYHSTRQQWRRMRQLASGTSEGRNMSRDRSHVRVGLSNLRRRKESPPPSGKNGLPCRSTVKNGVPSVTILRPPHDGPASAEDERATFPPWLWPTSTTRSPSKAASRTARRSAASIRSPWRFRPDHANVSTNAWGYDARIADARGPDGEIHWASGAPRSVDEYHMSATHIA